MNEMNRHPDPETIAAFVDGSLDDSAMQQVTAHIDECDDCLAEMKDLATFQREEGRVVPLVRRTRWWPTAAAAAVLTALIGGALLVHRPAVQRPSLVEVLADAAPSKARTVEPRLTGFRWAALRDPLRTESPAPDPQQLKLSGAAGEVLDRTANDNSAEARHAAGLAQLVIARPDDAIRTLRAVAAASPSDASAWSDLAAAYYVSAVSMDRSADLPQALAAADHAVKIDPTRAEALFNRALVLERLGLRHQAKDAWQQYLVQHPSPDGWSSEARKHLQSLDGSTSSEEFKTAMPQLEAAAAAGDAARVRAIVDRFRQQARRTCESRVLGEWGGAVLAHDAHTAEARLTVARMVGDALASLSGERMLTGAVAAIGEARGASRERALAEGHQAYLEAADLKGAGRSSAAEPIAARAAALFEQGRSPMALAARTLHAATVYDVQRTSEAIALLDPISQAVRGSGYIALDAQVSSLLGLAHANRGEWSLTISLFQRVAERDALIGERAAEAFTRSMLAETYDRLFDAERAWKERVAAFPVLSSEAANNRLCVALSGAIDSELRRGNLDSAMSFIELTLEEGRIAASPPAITDAYVRRALIETSRGNRPAAEKAIRNARATAMSIADEAVRDRAQAYVAIGAAALSAAEAPTRALQELEFAEGVYRKRGEKAELPLVLFERGRALRASGDADGALRSIDQALATIERQRLSMWDLELRAGIFDAAAGLLDDAIALLLDRGEYEKAFAYVERGRGRALAEEIAARGETDIARPAGVREIQAALPADTILVELAVLSDRVVAFVLTRSEFRASWRAISSAELAQEVTSFVDQTARSEGGGKARERAERLFALLLADSLAERDERRVVIVPDRFLQSVPYAALRDSAANAYLIESHIVRIAPRASLLAAPPPVRRKAGPVLVVGDPRVESGSVERLTAAATEASVVASIYRNSSLLTGGAATVQSFLDRAVGAWMIHFAGHGTPVDERGMGGSILFAGPQAKPLYAHEIASMNLHGVGLVVLAACDSLVGQGEHVEWTPTLAHSFLAAGANSVVGTLWPIRDRLSGEFFARFHRAIAAGAAADTALHDTQLFMIRSPDVQLHDPSAWAGVELISR